MIDLLMEYGLFLAKVATLVVAIAVLMVMGVSVSRRARSVDKLEVKDLNEKYRGMKRIMRAVVLPKKTFKKALKEDKARLKAVHKTRAMEPCKRLFVVDFHGDIKATGVASLREEITAILSLAEPRDEVLVRLENAGGLVHEHGLAASQLQRIKRKGIPLTIAVDKVAASGGYMMACVGNRIIAAPFAVLGSIGVLAQIPNFHRLLDQHGVDFELIKAGEFKRTLTMFGVNTDEDRKRLKEQIEDTHTLFKDFVAEHRAQLDMARVASGEHWYGRRAQELNLIDEIMTSDDYLLEASQHADIYQVRYTAGKRLSEKLVSVVRHALGRAGTSWRGVQERSPLL
jgi:serine protease SohB